MTRNRAMLLIVTGASFMSFVGLLMRLLETTDGMLILFYRSITLAGMVGLMACLRRRQSPAAFLRSLDRTDMMMGAALVGVALMIGDGLAYGRTAGNIVALVSSLTFAIMLVLARRSGKSDVLGGTFLGGAGCVLLGAFASLSFGNGLGISTHDLMLTLFMGAFTIGIGIALVTWGTGYVPAAEVSLLVLTESVLGPIWPWIILGQAMTLTEIGGGVIVLGAVAALALASREPGKPAAVKG